MTKFNLYTAQQFFIKSIQRVFLLCGLLLSACGGGGSTSEKITNIIKDIITDTSITTKSTQLTLSYPSSYSLTENATLNSTIGTIEAKNPNGQVVYKVSGNPVFNITSTGTLILASSLDYEVAKVHTGSVTVNDSSTTVKALITLKVINENDSTPQLTFKNNSIQTTENLSINTVVATATAIDNDNLGNLIYSLKIDSLNNSNPNPNPTFPFKISPQSGAIYVNSTVNYEASTQYLAILKVSDGLHFSTQKLTFNIVNVNDSTPQLTFKNNSIQTTENLSINTVVATATAIDNDNLGNLIYSLKIDSLNNSNPNPNPTFPFKINPQSGAIYVNSTVNYEASTQYLAILKVSDGLHFSTQKLTFNIVNVLELPKLKITDLIFQTNKSSSISILNQGEQRVQSCSSSPALPSSLLISVNSTNSTCIIQGTPLATQTKIQYIITATNAEGSSTSKLSIQIGHLPTITNLVVDSPITAKTTLNLNFDLSTGFAISHYYVMVSSSAISNNNQTNEPTAITQIPTITDPKWVSSNYLHSLTLSGSATNYKASLPITIDSISQPGYRTVDIYIWLKNQHDMTSNSINKARIQQTHSIAYNVTSANYADPLVKYQWHLQNTGQANFGSTAGTAGSDLNVKKVHTELGYKGKNIIVSVIDSGLEIAHEDLSANVIAGSKDFVSNDNDPSPINSTTKGDHGTSVAGLIAMRDSNSVGGIGVAPRASIVGFNYLKSQTLANFAHSMNNNTVSPDVINLSIGSANKQIGTINSDRDDLYLERLKNGRSGKGTVIVKSSGNGFRSESSFQCSFAVLTGASCALGIIDPQNTLPIIVVGAVNASGKRSSYSTAGSNLWIAGFGGEYGYASNRQIYSGGSFYYYYDRTYKQAMLTTDIMTCAYGYSRQNYGAGSYIISYKVSPNDFEYVWNQHINHVINNYYYSSLRAHSENSNCNYTATFNGTSSAAPTISGVTTLMLEANPKLTYRDVKHILAVTAKKIDPTYSVTYTKTGKSVVLSKGWQTNAANFHHSDWYGFGLADAHAAVAMASTYTANTWQTLTSATVKSGNASNTSTGYPFTPDLNLTTTNNNSTGASHTLAMTKNITIEHLELKLYTDNNNLKDLSIELKSPSGTKAIIFQPGSGIISSVFNQTKRLSSNAFYGESSLGNWTITIKDQFDPSVDGDSYFDSTDGKFRWWELTAYGH